MATATSQLFDVLLADDDENQVNIGRVEADPNFNLKIVSVVPEQEEFLTETVELVNDKDVLHVEAPPPEGAPMHAVFSRQVRRSAPEFPAEMQSYLQSYYDLTLKPAAG
jgi:hypothetical protein